MKKIIYIIPMLLMIFFMSNIYASSIPDIDNVVQYFNLNLGSYKYGIMDLVSGNDYVINFYSLMPRAYLNESGAIYFGYAGNTLNITSGKNAYNCYNLKFRDNKDGTFTMLSDFTMESGIFTVDNSKYTFAIGSYVYSRSYRSDNVAFGFNNLYGVNFEITDQNDTAYNLTPGIGFFEKEPTVDVICEYSSDFSQATLTAFILNAKGGEKLYYSGDIIFNSGLNSGSSEGQHSGAGSSFGEEADSLFQLYNNPVSYTTNRVVTFKLYDSNNNFICQTSYNITQIQNFNGVSFDVSFDTSNASYLIFTPTISALDNSYYSIYCKINTDTSDLLVTRNGNRFSNYSDTNYTLLSNNETITLKYTGLFSANVNIDFEIRNKNNGSVVLTRTYSYKISKSSDSTLNDIVENGTSTGGGLGSGFSSLNENSSINDIIETSKETFNTFSLIFDLLPGFVWAFLGVALTIIIVLRILGR